MFDERAADTGAVSAPGSAGGSAESFARLVEQMGPAMDEFVAVGPGEIKGELSTVAEATRKAQGGDLSGVESESFAKARQAIAQFDQQHCNLGSGSGEG